MVEHQKKVPPKAVRGITVATREEPLKSDNYASVAQLAGGRRFKIVTVWVRIPLEVPIAGARLCDLKSSLTDRSDARMSSSLDVIKKISYNNITKDEERKLAIMNFDSFEENIQVEEIIPEEYEEWLRFCQSDTEEDPFIDIDSMEDLFEIS